MPIVQATVDDLRKINYVLAKGDRAEVVPLKGEVKVNQIRREEVNI